MTHQIRVVLFSEVNSKLGAPFLWLLADDPRVALLGVTTSQEGRRCSYFVDDPEQVDLVAQAQHLGVPVFRPRDVNSAAFVTELRKLRPDYFIIGNYQQILKPELLAVPAETSINFHPSPLPRYAGLAPFFWMAKHGETESGVTAIEVAPGIDDGAIIMQRRIRLCGDETALSIRSSHERENVDMLACMIPQLVARSYCSMPQDLSQRSYFGRPRQHDYLIDFEQPVEEVLRMIRAGYRHPGAYTVSKEGHSTVILSARAAQPPNQLSRSIPGRVRHVRDGVFVSARDGWLQVVTVERQGQEVPARFGTPMLRHNALLTACIPALSVANIGLNVAQ